MYTNTNPNERFYGTKFPSYPEDVQSLLKTEDSIMMMPQFNPNTVASNSVNIPFYENEIANPNGAGSYENPVYQKENVYFRALKSPFIP